MKLTYNRAQLNISHPEYAMLTSSLYATECFTVPRWHFNTATRYLVELINNEMCIRAYTHRALLGWRGAIRAEQSSESGSGI